MGSPVLYSHAASLGHETGAHPENAQRIVALTAALQASDWLGLERRESPLAPSAAVEAVHSPALVQMVERLAQVGGFADADTVVSAGSWQAALRASGGAMAMVDELAAGSASAGFSVHRPPGHHAESSRAMGFCLINHIAVAAQHAIDEHRLERVAIVDFDVHHGNGTQEIFWERPDVQFFSVHQFPFYPGSGSVSEAGGGPGRGFTINVPVTAGSGDREFVEAIGRWGEAVADFDPQLVLVSAGFDAHADDPLGGCLMTDAGYAAIGDVIGARCVSLGVPVGVVLEGGYDVDALGRSFVAFARALTESCS